jgi:N-acylneuraminate cytidylyltransferase
MSKPSFCIIPVRGGSKGIPRKNLAEFGGMSLLEWTIQQAKQVYALQDIIVSTEDAELADIAKNAQVTLIQRPAELAQDGSSTNSVVTHLLGQIDPQALRYHHFTILQVTSPLRTPEDIQQAEAKMQKADIDSVLSAYAETNSHPAKTYLLEGETAVPIMAEMQYSRRQDLPTIYRRNGAIFSCTRQFFEQTGKLWGGRIELAIMPKEHSVDIDTLEDLQRARDFLSNL